MKCTFKELDRYIDLRYTHNFINVIFITYENWSDLIGNEYYDKLTKQAHHKYFSDVIISTPNNLFKIRDCKNKIIVTLLDNRPIINMMNEVRDIDKFLSMIRIHLPRLIIIWIPECEKNVHYVERFGNFLIEKNKITHIENKWIK